MNLLVRLVWLLLSHRRRGPISIWDQAVTPMRVLPNDLDLLWHMNNGRYLSLMDQGRVDLMVRRACGRSSTVGAGSPWWSRRRSPTVAR